MEENNTELSTSENTASKHILVYGKHDYILKNVQDLLSKSGFTSVGYTNLPEATDYLRLNTVNAVLIGGGVDPHDRLELKKLNDTLSSKAIFVEHYGGPATIISELNDALKW